ncbi:MAG: zinc-ribbon domain-containing protein [Promethearchaeota archaeon]
MTAQNRFDLRFPHLLVEFDPANPKKPHEYTYGSPKKVKWICRVCGHRWKATIKNRTKKDRPTGCPKCFRKRRAELTRTPTDKNRLTIHAPHLIEEFDFTKNPRPPHEFTYSSRSKVGWVCKICGYKWNARITERTRKDKPSGCPNCAKISRKKLQQKPTDQNRFTIHAPHLIEEFDFLNNPLPPHEYTYGSGVKAKWICRVCNYRWEARLNDRTRKKNPTGCPACDGKIVTDRNRLTIHAPHLIDEFDFLNNPKPPHEYSYGSQETVRWICRDCGYKWDAQVTCRTKKTHPTGCPACDGKIVTDKNRLTIHAPYLIDEFDFLNNSKPPHEYSYGSQEIISWICRNCGNKWDASIRNRTSKVNPSGCPDCGKLKGIHGPLPGICEIFGEKLSRLFYSNIKFQFIIWIDKERNKFIRPDAVIKKDKEAKIIKGETTYFDILLDFKINPYGPGVEKTKGDYAPHCKSLIILHLFDHRTAENHKDLSTGKKVPVHYLTFPELLKKLNGMVDGETITRKMLNELMEEYKRIIRLANNPDSLKNLKGITDKERLVKEYRRIIEFTNNNRTGKSQRSDDKNDKGISDLRSYI